MSSLYFLETHKLGAELGSFPPFLVREATRLHDNRRKVVKIYSKLGQNVTEQQQIQAETQFWTLVRHPRVIEIEKVFDEEGFIYIVYEFPEGGDLAALVLEQSRTFTEGFAKKVATALLNALIFLHSNGIMHGAVTPSNVVFSSPANVPGWADQSKLTFFRVDNSRRTTVFQDIQDLAFTTVSIMRRTPGLLSRKYFTPDVLQKKEWAHVTDDFVDFIEQLWQCEEKYRMAETFMSHPWLHSGGTADTSNSLKVVTTQNHPAAPLLSSPDDGEETIKGYLYFKLREKKKGRRVWNRRYGIVRHNMLLLYRSIDEDRVDNQNLCQAINLKSKNIFIFSMGSHDFMMGLQDTVLQQTVVWLRFDDGEEYSKWRGYLTQRYEKEVSQASLMISPSKNNMTHVLSSKQSTLANNLARNLANIIAADREQAPDVSDGYQEKKENNTSDRARSHAVALVQAVDDAAKEFSRSVEAQASSYIRKSKMLQLLRSNKIVNGQTGISFNKSLSPFPSEQKQRVHPSIKWDMRSEELMLVQATGTPVNKPISEGEQWFVIDATWFKHWISFVASSRRRAPPGPIDNLWMINPLTELPYEHMIEDTDENSGDFRRVPPQIWELFETWYGGGPAISVTGPPTEDTRRWVVHVEPQDDEKEGTGETLVELLGTLEHPEDIVQISDNLDGDIHIVVDLQKGTRRPSLAELNLLAKVGGFHDGGHDHVKSGLDAIMDSGSEEDSDESSKVEETRSSIDDGSAGNFVTLTSTALKSHDKENEEREISDHDDEKAPNDEDKFDDDDIDAMDVSRRSSLAKIFSTTTFYPENDRQATQSTSVDEVEDKKAKDHSLEIAREETKKDDPKKKRGSIFSLRTNK